jgi:hypothetical protein
MDNHDDNRIVLRKLDKITDKMADIDINIVEIRKDLNYHIKRTDLLEKQVVPVWTMFKAGSFVLGLASILSAIFAILRYINRV